MKKIKMVCSECGSDMVMVDAWAYWNFDKQEWELYNTFDYSYCETCEGDCHIKEIEIEEEEKIS